MDIVADRCPQGHPVNSAAILVGQLINTCPQKPCCFSSHARKQDKEERHRVDMHPKLIWLESQLFHLRRPLLECLKLQLLHWASQVSRETKGVHVQLPGLYSKKGKMRYWELVLVGNPAVTSLGLGRPQLSLAHAESERGRIWQADAVQIHAHGSVSESGKWHGKPPAFPVPSGHFGGSSSHLKLKNKPCPQVQVFLAWPMKIFKMLGETFSRS